ncbi:hypothetical protein N8445_00065 [bacterium]|nr:hypothetical protein [bacterium]
MAVIKIFPIQDSFIYTEKPLANVGRDEMLEIGGYNISAGGQTIRSLVKFDTNELKEAVNSVTASSGGTGFKVTFKANLAYGNELPIDISVDMHPLSESWDEGTGKFGDSPNNSTGCSWRYRSAGNSNHWQSASYASGVTASFDDTNKGGGVWYNTSASIDLKASTDFSNQDDFDLNIDCTNIFTEYYQEELPNHGVILKLPDAIEFNESASVRLKYFSGDTNTIYPPHLEISSTAAGVFTGTLTEIAEPDFVLTLKNNKGEYMGGDYSTYTAPHKQRFRVHCRPKYPTRTFTTSSAYLTNYVLPTGSRWSIVDENTEEVIVDYGSGTNINHDGKGNYFDIYMDGLQPERYYRLMVKTEIDGSTMVVDTKEVFKVVRNG